MIKKYSETYTDTHELAFIDHIGMGKFVDGTYDYSIQRLSDKEIIEILEYYIGTAHHKDWDRTGLSEMKCVGAAKDRIQSLKNK